MKPLGGLLIIIGICLLIFFTLSLLFKQPQLHSPIPLKNNVKVIYISPEKGRN
jgi:hypothetical protein